MRKILAISLAFIYIAFFGGFKLSMHFCGDNLTEYSIYATSSENVSCCAHHHGCSKEVAVKMSCCEDKSVYLYSDVNTTVDSYKLVQQATIFLFSFIILPEKKSQETPVYFNSNAPPLKQGRSIYQLNSSFTFYG